MFQNVRLFLEDNLSQADRCEKQEHHYRSRRAGAAATATAAIGWIIAPLARKGRIREFYINGLPILVDAHAILHFVYDDIIRIGGCANDLHDGVANCQSSRLGRAVACGYDSGASQGAAEQCLGA